MDQDLPSREARIRECAYHLWEAEGKPYGRDVEFWQRARDLVLADQNDEASSMTDTAIPRRGLRRERRSEAPAKQTQPTSGQRKAAPTARKSKTS